MCLAACPATFTMMSIVTTRVPSSRPGGAAVPRSRPIVFPASNVRARRIGLVAFLVFFGLGSTWNIVTLSPRALRKRASEPALVALPRREVVRRAALGFHAALADLYWVQALQYYTSPRNEKVAFSGLANYLELVVELAPDFRYVYRFAGVAIPWNSGAGRWLNAEPAVRLLRKGVQRFPDDWFLRLLLSYNLSAGLQQYEEAAEQLLSASRLPGAPSYFPQLATRLLATAGNLDTAAVIAAQVARDADNPELREAMEHRVAEIAAERDLRILDKAIHQYRERYRAPPRALEELVESGLLTALPEEPLGGRYFIGPSGEAKSTSLTRRLMIFEEAERNSSHSNPHD
jgi:hypothetical protein